MALAMVLLGPGITGTGVQWLHACPSEAQASADHQHHDSTPSQPAGHSDGCECIGSCHAAGLIASARAGAILALLAEPPRPVVPSTGNRFVPLATPTDLLPPATAPPLS
jgi:hypothetical protein